MESNVAKSYCAPESLNLKVSLFRKCSLVIVFFLKISDIIVQMSKIVFEGIFT